jgi:heat shock protein HslJ
MQCPPTNTGLKFKNATHELLISENKPIELSALVDKKYLVSKAFSLGNEMKPDFKMIVEFSENAMQLQLNANSCSAACEISDDQIKFSEGLTCTEKCCDSELAQKLAALFTGTMQYVIDEEHPVIFNKNSRIWLVPFKEGKKENSRVNVDELIGKDFKILDVTILPQDNDSQKAITQKYSFDYILSFRTDGLGLKLDKNTCNTSATYNDNTIDIGSSMGCTKLCCDSKESVELKNYLKGKFYLKENGSEIIMSNDEISLRLLKF